MGLVAAFVIAVLLAGCAGTGGGAPAAAPPKAAEAPAQAAPEAAAPEVKPAVPAKPAAESKPVAQKPAVESKPVARQPAATTPTRITLGSPPSTSGYYVYTVGLAKLLQSKIPNLGVTVSEGAGAPLNAKRLREGTFDFAIAGFATLYAVAAGIDPGYKDQPVTEARILWVFEQLANVWFVREDAGITTVEQLHGKDFSPGGKGTGTELVSRVLVFPQLGVEPRWYVGSMEDGLAAVKDRRIVGMAKGSSVKRPDALIQDAMATTRIRVLSWTPDQVAKVQAKYPFLGTADIPAGTYRAAWNERPIPTWGEGIGIWTLNKFSDALAYAFAKVVVEDNKEGAERQQAAVFPSVKDSDIAELTMTQSTVPLHAGSYKYFSEIGKKVPDHLKPPEAR